MDEIEELIDFFVKTSSLKRTLRYSSCPEKIQESTAGHSWLMTFMVPILAEKFNLDVDVAHAMEIANVHDLPEYVLDYDFDSYLVSTDVLKEEDKKRSEESVMLGIENDFDFGKRLYSLWREFEEQKTPEARFVKAIDKLESHIHIIERGGTGKDEDDARHQMLCADNAVKNFPQLEPFLKLLKKRLRPLMEAQGLMWKSEYNYLD